MSITSILASLGLVCSLQAVPAASMQIDTTGAVAPAVAASTRDCNALMHWLGLC